MKAAYAVTLVALGLALVPGTGVAGGLPYHATHDIPVANASFSGAVADDYRHDHALMRFNLSPSHSIAEHILPWIYREKIDSGRSKRHLIEPFALARPGDYVFQKIELGSPEYIEGRPPEGVLYVVKVPFGARHGESSVTLRVQLRDADNRVVMDREETSTVAAAGWPLAGDMRLEINASRVASARYMTLGIRDASGTDIELGEVAVQRVVTTHPIINTDFDD